MYASSFNEPTDESLESCARNEIRTLVALSHFLGVLHPFLSLLVDAVDFGKSNLTQRARVFTLGPLFDASKAEHVFTPVYEREVFMLNIAHADTAVLLRFNRRRFPIITIVSGTWRGFLQRSLFCSWSLFRSWLRSG